MSCPKQAIDFLIEASFRLYHELLRLHLDKSRRDYYDSLDDHQKVIYLEAVFGNTLDERERATLEATPDLFASRQEYEFSPPEEAKQADEEAHQEDHNDVSPQSCPSFNWGIYGSGSGGGSGVNDDHNGR